MEKMSFPEPTAIHNTQAELGIAAAANKITTPVEKKIAALANKVLSGQELSQSEKIDLATIATRRILFKAKILPKSSASKIDILRKNIIAFKGNITDAQRMLKTAGDFGQMDKSTQNAMAKLVLAYDAALQQSPFFTKVKQFTGANFNEAKVKNLIATHNTSAPPRAQLAGTLAISIGNHNVYYTKTGKLELAPPNKKTCTPITLAPSNVKMDEQRVSQLKDAFNQIYENTPYNNVSPMLEFMKFFRGAKKSNPNLTLKQAYEAYNPSPTSLYDKYKSGDCVIVAGKAQSALKEIGCEAAVVGQYTKPPWANPPVPDGRSAGTWTQYDNKSENVHHCAVVVKYSDVEGQEKGLYMDPTFDGGKAIKEVEDYNDTRGEGMDALIKENKRDTPSNITNVGHILKMQMAGKTKMVLMGKGPEGPGQILGVDLMRNNIYVNGEGIKGLKLPLGANGRFSLNLQDLKDPNAKGTYMIDGQSVTMSHREALSMFVEEAKDRFQLPDDFAENMITLAENSEEIFQSLILPPAQAAKAVLKESTAALAQVQEVVNKKESFSDLRRSPGTPPGIKDLISEYSEKLEVMRAKFDDLQKAIIDNNLDGVRKFAKEVAAMSAEQKALAERIENGPMEIDIN